MLYETEYLNDQKWCQCSPKCLFCPKKDKILTEDCKNIMENEWNFTENIRGNQGIFF